MASHIIPASEVRAGLFLLLDKIARLRERYTITRGGLAEAVIMSSQEFEEWVETVEIMSRPATVKGIRKGLKELKQKRFVSHEKVFGRRAHAHP